MSTQSTTSKSVPDKSFMGDFRRFFFRGLAVLLPSILTLWILWYAFVFLFRNVAEPVNTGIRTVVIAVTPRVLPEDRLPPWFRVSDAELAEYRATLSPRDQRRLSPEQLRAQARAESFKRHWQSQWYLSGVGLLVAIIAVYLAGVLLGGLIGRRLYARLERMLFQLPGFKQIYPHVKQLVEMIMGDKPLAFKRVVLVEYPRKGIWTMGFVTSSSLKRAAEAAEGPCVSIFIPSTPTPFTGFTINVPERDLIDVPFSVDEAIRFVLTGGVLVPTRQAMPSLESEERKFELTATQPERRD